MKNQIEQLIMAMGIRVAYKYIFKPKVEI